MLWLVAIQLGFCGFACVKNAPLPVEARVVTGRGPWGPIFYKAPNQGRIFQKTGVSVGRKTSATRAKYVCVVMCKYTVCCIFTHYDA